MNCSAPIPGPRGDRDWWDRPRAKLPERAPKLRTVLLWTGAYLLVVAALAVGGGFVLQWWRSS